MSWSERHYEPSASRGFRSFRQDAVFWLVAAVVGAHVLKVLMVGLEFCSAYTPAHLFGVSTDGLLRGRFWQPLTYQFVHGGEGHLFFNGISLFLMGRWLEPLMGQLRTARLCLVCGAVAGLSCFLMRGNAPIIGISGGLNGMMVAAWCLAPNMPVNIWVAVVRLKWVCGFFLLLDILGAMGGGYGPAGSRSGTAHETHLAGAFAGFFAAWIWPRYLQPQWRARRAQRQRKREQELRVRELNAEQELDRILAKINAEGMGSLTETERTFLRQRATRYQETRKP